MEPISTIVTGYATDKLVQLAERVVHKHVIERWTRNRAIEFYRYFCASLFAEETDEAIIQELLNQMLSDDTKSEIIFEAYRLVCLTKSKIIGPRIIAVIVAEIIQRNGIANDNEETSLAVAEVLSDHELLSFCREVKELGENEQEEFEVILEEQHLDSNTSNQQINIVQGSLVNVYGTWAEKMKTLGLISESVTEKNYKYEEDSERHIDMNGSIREIVWSVHFHKPSRRLTQLVERLSFDIAT